MEDNKAIAALTITDFDIDPEEITARIGIRPSKVWRRGDPVVSARPAARKHRENGWSYAVEVTGGEEDCSLWLGRALDELVGAISTRVSSFECLPPNASREVSCYARFDSTALPVINFNKRIVSVIAAINASIDVDMTLNRRVEAEDPSANG